MTEYQPKHLAPSLDYEAWITDLKADENKALFRERGLTLGPMDTATSTTISGLEPGETYLVTLRAVGGKSWPQPESLAGHEWTSRSWFQ